ncbi:MAG: hypothetical protein LBG28_13155, partial [Tannerella sp.]|nr:hypothetical protein [Tannerella sp.]
PPHKFAHYQHITFKYIGNSISDDISNDGTGCAPTVKRRAHPVEFYVPAREPPTLVMELQTIKYNFYTIKYSM